MTMFQGNQEEVMLHGRLLGTHCRRAWAKEGKHSPWPWPWPWPLGGFEHHRASPWVSAPAAAFSDLRPRGSGPAAEGRNSPSRSGENRWILTQVMC